MNISNMITKATKGSKNLMDAAKSSSASLLKNAQTGLNNEVQSAMGHINNVQDTIVSDVKSMSTSIESGIKRLTQKGGAANSTNATNSLKLNFDMFKKTDNIIPMLTVLTLIVYMVIVSPSSVLEIFSHPVGKFMSLALVVFALYTDIRLGILLGFAVMLSITMAVVSADWEQSFHESFVEDDRLATKYHQFQGTSLEGMVESFKEEVEEEEEEEEEEVDVEEEVEPIKHQEKRKGTKAQTVRRDAPPSKVEKNDENFTNPKLDIGEPVAPISGFDGDEDRYAPYDLLLQS